MHRLRARQGLTILEVVVALVLLATGVLGTLSVQAGVMALQSRSAGTRALASRLDATLDSLRASPCAALTPGSGTSREGRIDWRVTRAARSIAIDATATPVFGTRVTRARTIVPCA